MKIEITPYRFADLIYDLRVFVASAELNLERSPDDKEAMEMLLDGMSDKIEEIEMATNDVKTALNYLSRCME